MCTLPRTSNALYASGRVHRWFRVPLDNWAQVADVTNGCRTESGVTNSSSFYHQTLSFNALSILRVVCDWHRIVAELTGSRDMKKILKDFIANESGATAIEYGLIAAGISLAIIAAVNGLGTKLNTKFTAINNSLK
jgi:pilus assembly protein Flp/PilA